ncbi:MAG: phosphatase PAP2 family protein [Longimicrobiales bacterium]|nr:phosphatase PAP2 family protein [Longimicrobiales bacterium]
MHLILPAALAVTAAAAPLSAAPPSAGDTSLVADIRLGTKLVLHGVTAPTRWTAEQWLTLPAAAATLAVISLADEEVEGLAQRDQGAVGDAYFGTLEPFGEHYSLLLAAGIYAGGWALDRPAWRRTAVEAAASSVVAAGIVTPTLKLVIGRVRPRDGESAYEFRPFSGHYSFPSGHTTQAFAVASVIAAESDAWVVDVLAYGLAASVGGARIYHDAHFLTDVLAGAAIGTVVGHTMVREGRQRRDGWEPFVAVGPGGPGLGVRLRF